MVIEKYHCNFSDPHHYLHRFQRAFNDVFGSESLWRRFGHWLVIHNRCLSDWVSNFLYYRQILSLDGGSSSAAGMQTESFSYEGVETIFLIIFLSLYQQHWKKYFAKPFSAVSIHQIREKFRCYLIR